MKIHGSDLRGGVEGGFALFSYVQNRRQAVFRRDQPLWTLCKQEP
jgi:hypothetical protein